MTGEPEKILSDSADSEEARYQAKVSRDAYADMVKDSKYADNKELMIIPGAVHTDLYDGGSKGAIPFEKLQEFFGKYLQ